MVDARASVAARVARLDRRRLIGAAAGGALLGSAWAASFRDAVMAGDDTLVSVARTATALGVLIEHRNHRIMLIDAADGPAAGTVTELCTGFLRQRIDAVLLPASSGDPLPPDYTERWRVGNVWTLPDRPGPAGSSLAGRSLAIGNLRVATDALPLGAWRGGAPRDSAWYVAATFGTARIIVLTDGAAVGRLPLDASMATAVVCFDVDFEPGVLPAGIDLLVVPVEAADRVPPATRVISLAATEPVAMRMRDGRIEAP